MNGWNDTLRRELHDYIGAVWIPQENTFSSVRTDDFPVPSRKFRARPAVRGRAAADVDLAAPMPTAPAPVLASLGRNPEPEEDLARRLAQLDEGFSRTLLRLIDEKGLSDAECYRRAGVDRRHFSKIRSDPDYRPSKGTAAAFAFALGLTLDEAQALLGKAGFTLSHASKFDVILEYFLTRGITDVDTVNAALYEFDQPLLGAR